jgi:hypothetical protein
LTITGKIPDASVSSARHSSPYPPHNRCRRASSVTFDAPLARFIRRTSSEGSQVEETSRAMHER